MDNYHIIELWNFTSGTTRDFSNSASYGHTDQVLFLKLLNNETYASASKDTTINIWSTSNGSYIKTLYYSVAVLCLEYLNDGSLISGSADLSIVFWDLNSGTAIDTITNAHTKQINYLKQLPNGLLVSASNGNGAVDGPNIKIWNLTTKTNVRNLTGHTNNVNVLELLSNGYLASGSTDNTVIIWYIEKKC